MKCKTCGVKKSCRDYGNCDGCDHVKAYIATYKKGYAAGKQAILNMMQDGRMYIIKDGVLYGFTIQPSSWMPEGAKTLTIPQPIITPKIEE